MGRCLNALVFFALCLAACGPFRPTVVTSLDALHTDPQKRQEQLLSGQARPSAEQRQRLPRKLRRPEAAIASALALIASLLSHGKNAFVGLRIEFEENAIFERRFAPSHREQRAKPPEQCASGADFRCDVVEP
jgi:hypothetical protein